MPSSSTSPRPRLACEITADRVIAARASDRGEIVEAYSARTLAAGALSPSLSGANVAQPEALRQAIGSALEAVGGRGRDLIAVLPDAAVRIALLDFDTLPQREQEAAGIIRFRLRKSLPFDVDRAALSYHVRRDGGAVRVIAAVAPRDVVDEYEAAFRDLGYGPGVVLPSMLAALGPVYGDRPTLVIKVESTSISVAIVDKSELRLVRTLENPAGAQLPAAQLAADVYPSVVFYEDTYGAKIEHVLLAGSVSVPVVAPALESQTGVHVQELVTGRYLGTGFGGDIPRTLLAGVVGALVA